MTHSYYARSALGLLVGVFLGIGVPLRAQNPGSGPAPTQVAAASDPDRVADQITAVPNRPTFSTTAEAVEDGVFEIEYGFEAADGHQNINGLMKFGLTANLELRFANNPMERDGGIAGGGDSGAGFKYRIFRQRGWRPTFSVLYTATIPTATVEVGAGAVGHSGGILVSKDFGKHHFDFNETVQWLGRSSANGFDRDYFTALAYSHGIGEKWGATTEIAGFSRANVSTPATMTMMAAATYNVSTRLVLDGGCYIAGYGRLPRATFFGGITYSIADLYHRHGNQNRKAH
jgi:hypothetical protein